MGEAEWRASLPSRAKARKGRQIALPLETLGRPSLGLGRRGWHPAAIGDYTGADSNTPHPQPLLPMPQPARKPRRWLGPAIKLAIVALLIWGVHRTLGEAFTKLREQPWHLMPGWLILSGRCICSACSRRRSSGIACCACWGRMPVGARRCGLILSAISASTCRARHWWWCCGPGWCGARK